MKTILPIKLELGRILNGPMGSTSKDGMSGAFRIKTPRDIPISIISSGVDMEYGWEHVSVSLQHRTPTWDEMCFVKDLFWDPEETVVQYHPPRSEYVNHHPFCLHLWKPILEKMPFPPAVLVGPKSGSNT